MADSHTGNHLEDDFTLLETIRRSYSVIRERTLFELEGETFESERRTVFYAPPGYVRLYTHSFSLVNLRLPLTEFFCEQNKLDLKSFKDKIPPNIKENLMFQRLSRYPISVCVFPDPIHFLAGLKPSWKHEMAFRNFICTEDDEDLTFLLKEPSPGFSTGSPYVSRGSSRPHVKRKLASGSFTSRATRAKTSSSKDDASFLTVSDDDEDLELLDLHDRCYARQAVVDNAVNRMSHELLQVIDKLKGECDVLMSRERARDEEYEGLRVKCEAAMTNFEKNPAVKWAGYQQSLLNLESTALETEKARLEAIELSTQKETVQWPPILPFRFQEQSTPNSKDFV
nr:hypothetical protein [Tanacetum cinerariifolium]